MSSYNYVGGEIEFQADSLNITDRGFVEQLKYRYVTEWKDGSTSSKMKFIYTFGLLGALILGFIYVFGGSQSFFLIGAASIGFALLLLLGSDLYYTLIRKRTSRNQIPYSAIEKVNINTGVSGKYPPRIIITYFEDNNRKTREIGVDTKVSSYKKSDFQDIANDFQSINLPVEFGKL